MIKKENLVGLRCEPIESSYESNWLTKIGSGAFGIVTKAKLRGTKQTRAIKRIAKNKVRGESEFMNEIEILTKLDHPNIIKFYEYYEDSRHVFMVMELCTGGELFDKIMEKGQFSELEAREAVLSIAQALRYCHDNGVVHRDLKPENLLLKSKSEDSPIKLIDFGLAIKFNTQDTKKKGLTGTAFYIAPEAFDGEYGPWSDIWSLGVILYILLTGIPPFNGEDDEEIMKRVRKGIYKIDPLKDVRISKEGVDIINRMLTRNVKERITAAGILEHAWFKERIEYHPFPVSVDTLRKFMEYNQLKKLGLSILATQLEGEEIERLGGIFKSIDSNNDGVLSREEIKMCLKEVNLPAHQFDKIIDSIDTDENGRISYNEFVASSLSKNTYSQDENLTLMFRILDRDGSGKITKNELWQILDDFATATRVEGILREADKDGDDEISFAEFLTIMKK